MKTSPQFTRACLVVSLVFGFAACSYDNEMQTPKRVSDKTSAPDPGLNSGRPSNPHLVQKKMQDGEV